MVAQHEIVCETPLRSGVNLFAAATLGRLSGDSDIMHIGSTVRPYGPQGFNGHLRTGNGGQRNPAWIWALLGVARVGSGYPL